MFNDGTYPGSWDATTVGNLCTQTDAELDGMSSPDTLSTTDTSVVYLANLITYRKVIHANWASGDTSKPEPVVWNPEVTRLFDNLMNETFAWVKVVDTVSDED